MGTADNLAEPAADSLGALLARAERALAALDGHGPALARLEAELLLAHVIEQPRSVLIAHAERSLDAAAAARYLRLVARRAAGEPLAYLTAQREFWSLPLCVSPAVLIPRPETELVVERALALLAQLPARAGGLRVADLGTGSGAIALALAATRSDLSITATDRSADALQVARANASRLHLRQVEFLESDWFAALPGRRFDAIVSNPPYIAAADPALPALRFEPAMALSPGPTGLEALRHLIAQACAHLERGAWLVLEHGPDQAGEVAAALVAAGYARVRCHRDLAGRERVTEAQW